MYKKLLNSLLWRLGYSYRYNKIMPKFIHATKERYNGKLILGDKEANEIIRNKINYNKPFLVSRLGSVELSVLYNYVLYNEKNIKWDKNVCYSIQNNAGFFPVSDENLILLSEKYKSCLSKVDIMGVWFNEGEEEVCNKYCSDIDYIRLAAIEPYYHQDPWSLSLKGKNVLVIHPYEESIKFQYEVNREKLFENQFVLPEFNLKTIKAVQSIGGNQTCHDSWFAALDFMCKQIDRIDFDIAIIGAGAYGLPLGAYIKDLGKQAIHMGGSTQILFGIRGKRWENMPNINKYFNDSWKRPYDYENIKNPEKIENGCYW